MANKTLWKQMSGKLFTLIQIFQGEGFQNIFLKYDLTLMDKRLGLTAGTFTALFCHNTCVGGGTSGSLPLPWELAKEHQAWLVVLLTHRRPGPGSRAKGRRMQQGGTPPAPCCGSPCASSQCSGSSQHKSCPQQNTPEISNILHYVASTAK